MAGRIKGGKKLVAMAAVSAKKRVERKKFRPTNVTGLPPRKPGGSYIRGGLIDWNDPPPSKGRFARPLLAKASRPRPARGGTKPGRHPLGGGRKTPTR